jgi:hypothetical protein
LLTSDPSASNNASRSSNSRAPNSIGTSSANSSRCRSSARNRPNSSDGSAAAALNRFARCGGWFLRYRGDLAPVLVVIWALCLVHGLQFDKVSDLVELHSINPVYLLYQKILFHLCHVNEHMGAREDKARIAKAKSWPPEGY